MHALTQVSAGFCIFKAHTHMHNLTNWCGMQVESAGEAVMQLRAKPFLDVQWEMLNHNPSILYFKHITLQIQASIVRAHSTQHTAHALIVA